MALDQAAFNATVIAVQNNKSDFAPYLVGGTLNVSGQAIIDADAQALAVAFKNNTSVHNLSLYNNAIGDIGMIMLAQVLAENNSVKSLSLYGNQINRLMILVSH